MNNYDAAQQIQVKNLRNLGFKQDGNAFNLKERGRTIRVIIECGMVSVYQFDAHMVVEWQVLHMDIVTVPFMVIDSILNAAMNG